MATPMNNAKVVNETSLEDRRWYNRSASVDPSTNGATMLACEVAIVAWTRPRSRPPFSSNPTRNMYRMTPSCAITPRKGATAVGRIWAEISGAKRKQGSITLEESLARLARDGVVEVEEARARAAHPEEFENYLKNL